MLQFRSTEIGLLVMIFLFRPDVLLPFTHFFNLKVHEPVCRAEDSTTCSQFCFLVLQPVWECRFQELSWLQSSLHAVKPP